MVKYCLKHTLKPEGQCDENCVKFPIESIFDKSLKAAEKWVKETPEEEKKAQMSKYYNPDNSSKVKTITLGYTKTYNAGIPYIERWYKDGEYVIEILTKTFVKGRPFVLRYNTIKEAREEYDEFNQLYVQ